VFLFVIFNYNLADQTLENKVSRRIFYLEVTSQQLLRPDLIMGLHMANQGPNPTLKNAITNELIASHQQLNKKQIHGQL